MSSLQPQENIFSAEHKELLQVIFQRHMDEFLKNFVPETCRISLEIVTI
jgi:hypothetical protein